MYDIDIHFRATSVLLLKHYQYSGSSHNSRINIVKKIKSFLYYIYHITVTIKTVS